MIIKSIYNYEKESGWGAEGKQIIEVKESVNKIRVVAGCGTLSLYINGQYVVDLKADTKEIELTQI